MQALKQKLEQGELGRVFQIFCRRIGLFPTRIRDVGVVIDLATHDLDVMRFLLSAGSRGFMLRQNSVSTRSTKDLAWGFSASQTGA